MPQNKKILMVSFQSLSAQSGQGMARLGYYLSAELHKRGILKEFIISSKGKFDTPFPSSPVSFWSRYYLFIINKLEKIFKLKPYKSRYLQEVLFDWFCSMKVTDDITDIVSTNSYLKRTFKKARKKGIRTYTIPANPEDNFIYNLVTEEQKKYNIHFTDAYTYRKRLDYYNGCLKQVHKIITTPPITYETYLAVHGKDKVIYIPGHLKPDFKPATPYVNESTEPFNVSYVAYTVLLKGLQYLLEAWELIMAEPGTGHMQLHIGGGIDAPVHEYIKKRFSSLKNVHYTGYVSNIPAFFKEKHVFVAPSLVEGGPVTVLEAAHYGVPVILTRNCGSRDFFEKEDTGWVIPIRDAAAIRDKIMWVYKNYKEAAQIGLNAKKGLDEYKMQDFLLKIADTLQNESGSPR